MRPYAACAALLLVTACGHAHAPARVARDSSGSSTATTTAPPSRGGTPSGSAPSARPGAGAAPSGTARPPSPSGTAPVRSAVPAPHDVAVHAGAEPRCVRPGGTVQLTVRTQPDAAVAYGAKYADGGYGAAPPFGKGYGGSDHGTANGGGTYEASWTVAPTAPAGPAAVEVVVGWRGKSGSARAAFAVSSVDGTC